MFMFAALSEIVGRIAALMKRLGVGQRPLSSPPERFGWLTVLPTLGLDLGLLSSLTQRFGQLTAAAV